MRALLLLAALLAAAPARAMTNEDSALERLHSDDVAVREKACLDLARAPEHGPRVYPALFLTMDRDLSERVRLAAVKAVISFPGDDAVRRAKAFLQSEPGAQNRVAFTLTLATEPAHLQDGIVTDIISAMLFDDPSPEERLAAATGLMNRGDRRATPAVRRVAENDADKSVRDAAKRALAVLTAPIAVHTAQGYKPKPPKPDAVKGKDSCPEPWGWCECSGPIKRTPKCLERADCRIEVDTMMQLGMPCSWNAVQFDAVK